MSIVEVSGLCKTYPSFCLSDVSFTLDEGRIAGFKGRNGAGKTAIIMCMFAGRIAGAKWGTSEARRNCESSRAVTATLL